MDYIVNREVTLVDTVRVLIDHEDEESLPTGDDRLNFMRHMMINSAMSMPAKVANEAIPMKKCCGKASYTIATLKEAIKCNVRQDLFNVTVDGKKVTREGKDDVGTVLLMPFNGKNTGAGMIINPFAVMNDGLVDLTFMSDERRMGLFGIADLLDKAAKKGGIQTYENAFTHVRGKSIRIEFYGSHKRKPKKGFGQQLLGIDGEDLRFSNFVKYDCVPANVEFLFNPNTYYND